MAIENQISGLCKLSNYLNAFLKKDEFSFDENDAELNAVLRKSEVENSWMTIENQKFALNQWVSILNEENIKKMAFSLSNREIA